MVEMNKESRMHLLNPVSRERLELPPLLPYLSWLGWGAALSSSPASENCTSAVQGFNGHLEREISAQFRCLAVCNLREKIYGMCYFAKGC